MKPRGFLLALGLAASLLGACKQTGPEAFTGKWRSTRTNTPLYLYANGEWEIKAGDGAVLQYGVWEYKNDRLIWSYSVGGHVVHDVNPVVAVKPREFQAREADGSLTTFYRLD